MPEGDAGDAQKRLVDEYSDQHHDFEQFALVLKRTIEGLLRHTTYEFDVVDARAKGVASVREKILRKRYTSFDQLTDLCGVRIICYYESQIEDIAALLAREFTVLEDSKHGGGQPDTFGYTSRHLLIRLNSTRQSLAEFTRFETMVAEVQIRTILQHAWASISHALTYKSEVEVPEQTRRRLARVAALLEEGDEIFDTYRREIEATRMAYKRTAERSDWRDLPLDLESVIATWRKLPLEELARSALKQNWREPSFSSIYESAEQPIGNLDRASRLTRVAVGAGLTSIGQLETEARETESDVKWLSSFEHTASDYVPFAIGPDVLGLSLISKYGEPAWESLRRGRYAYVESLVETALQCRRDHGDGYNAG